MGGVAIDILNLGIELDNRLKYLSTFTDVEGEMTRLTLMPAHQRALIYLESEFKAAGMTTEIDAMGTLRGRYASETTSNKTLVIGSHIDTVRNAGIYDGNLGVVIGLAVVEHYQRNQIAPPVTLEIVAFGDEEGVRFPSTLTGSKYRAGQFDPAWLDEQDQEGVTRQEALNKLGVSFESVSSQPCHQTMIGYIEVHIEQGPVLDSSEIPLGIVTAINGVTRGEIHIVGRAGHAGTLPMTMRHDAVAAAAEMILIFEEIAKKTTNLVATNGVVMGKNPAINVVSGDVRVSFDVRSPSDHDRLQAVHEIKKRIAEIAERRGVTASIKMGHEANAAPCDATLMQALHQSVSACGIQPLQLPSGAGHDAMSFHGIMPMAMLFVRCKDGISHHPSESIYPQDIGLATQVLIHMIDQMK
jgi:allantoate deiminase